MKLTKLLSSSAYFVLNKELIKKIGIEPTLLLSDLISKEEYFIERNMLVDGYFFNTLENLTTDTTMSPHKLRNAFEILIKKGFIKTKLSGIPAKRHIKIFHDKLLNYLTTIDKKPLLLINKNKVNTKVLTNNKGLLNLP